MECKDHSGFIGSDRFCVLIETLWNVKSLYESAYLQVYIVLIETLWNVKSFPAPRPSMQNRVLIETLWNVKHITLIIWWFRCNRINRNIVECKENQVYLYHPAVCCINRNIVECKVD